MSRRHLRALAAALGLATAGAAGAQSPRPFLVQTYQPPPAGDRFLVVDDAEVPAHLVPSAALVLSWASDPLVLKENGAVPPGGEIVHTQLWAYAQGAVGVAGRVLLEATLPVVLSQGGSRPLPDLPQVESTALGDLRLGARLALPRLGPLATAVAAELWLPTGSTTAFASDGSVRFEARGIVSGQAGHVEYGGQIGLLYRASRDLVVTSTGSALTWGAAAAWRQGAWRAGPELYGRFQFEGMSTSPAEVLLAGHWTRDAFDVSLGAGTQLDQAPGAAPYRVVARVSWRPPDRSAEEAARLAADKAARDQAAAQQAAAERAATERAAADRVAAERAAAEAGLAAAAALAAADKAALDRAAAERAAAEAAMAVAAAEKLKAQPALVKLTAEKIEILQAVQFEVDSDVLRPVSTPILQQVVWTLQAHPGITKVLVEGHTDSQGDPAHNQRLSEARATRVMAWLAVQGGIAPARLEARGYGPDRPVGTNTTAEGRARNRRVEFTIVEQPAAP